MKEHEIDGISLSKWKRLKEMLDRTKRFYVTFAHDNCGGSGYFFNTLKEAKEYIMKWIRDQGVLFDLSSVAIYDQYDNGRLVKRIDGDRLYKRYFKI